MDLGIAGKVALVTASTRGIGLGIAQALASEGARVAIAARTEADVKRTADSLGGLGIAVDLMAAEGPRRAVEETVKGLGRIDILVNNLGLRAGSTWGDTGPMEFETAFEGNVTVSVRMSQLVLPGMLERGWGRIVTITSVWGRETGGAPAYNAAKAAEISFTKSLAREVAPRGVTVNSIGFTKSLAREVAPTGVTVNSIAPGSILWPGGGWDRRQKADPDGIAEFVRHDMPLGRFGTVEEVASVVTYVCSKQASLVNGAVIAVDGGQSRSGI